MTSIIVFLPLIAAIIVGLTSRTIKNSYAQAITCGGMVVSALLSLYMLAQFVGIPFCDPHQITGAICHGGWNEVFGASGLVFKTEVFSWISSGGFDANWTLRVDALTAVMLVVVTNVSAVVHIYSIGYMSHDAHQPRFFAYLSLFTFFMLMLVTADNLVQLFFGWEGVGLCSYLLIGFWYHKKSACDAAMKAFLVNRVGDIAFALGIFAIYVLTGSVQFDAIFAVIPTLEDARFQFLSKEYHALTLVGILLFIGAMGKSAQFGLHTWLPDAMEGPTPVSALIHAATMVTAGVFLVCRMSPIYEMAPTAMAVVTIVGAFTALFAATVGLVQNDIKRVIAYSTCSQLGYMFFAAGVGAYAAAIFHLMTHAFFKALLFLGAGSVIHGMSDEQDMRRMGGLWHKMPITYVLMWIGSLALAGVPLFAGFYSKDMVLEAAYAAGDVGEIAFWFGIAAAFLTAFYSGRLLFMTFHNESRAPKEVQQHIHESSTVMLAPLMWLALGSIFAGALGYHVFGMVSGDARFWQASIASHVVVELAHHVPTWVKILPLLMGVIGLVLSWNLYVRRKDVPAKLAAKFPRLYRFLLHKWYVDELYDEIFVRPCITLSKMLWKTWDTKIIDGLGPNGAARVSQICAHYVSAFQNGRLNHYALTMLVGFFLFVSWVVYHG